MICAAGLVVYAIIREIINLFRSIKAHRHLLYVPLTLDELKALNINDVIDYMLFLRDYLSYFAWGERRYVHVPWEVEQKIQESVEQNFEKPEKKYEEHFRFRVIYFISKDPVDFSNEMAPCVVHMFKNDNPSHEHAPKRK